MTEIGLALAALLALAPRATVTVSANDNVRPAGILRDGVLRVRLIAGTGRWAPEGAAGTQLDVEAFGEDHDTLSVPGPLLRVPSGTIVHVSLGNTLSAALNVHGLCSRPGPCETTAVPAGESRDLEFRLDAPGTYYYWAATSDASLEVRTGPDSQLGGAIVVDSASTGPAPDRVFAISLAARSPAPGVPAALLDHPVLAINGRSWPHTEILEHSVGDTVRWRVVNLSGDGHAMHLHGFHFVVESEGNGTADTLHPPEGQRSVVTQRIAPGSTFAMRWSPRRSGRWLFHCHMVPHMAALPDRTDGSHSHGSGQNDAGVAGLVPGINVTGPDAERREDPGTPRTFSVIISEEPQRYGDRKGYRVDVEGVEAPRLDSGPVPGPLIVLTRDEPVAIAIQNRTSDPTAIHWHGIELDSYFDGVPGWGGRPGSITPAIEPGQSFVVRFTPPRAGTFIYHTHWHDDAQLAAGIYGPLLVLEPGQKYDPTVDHVLVVGLNGVLRSGSREPFALNGRSAPSAIQLQAGKTHRLRVINITPANVALTMFLTTPTGLSEWCVIAKDGADLVGEHASQPARQAVSVGETYDFEVTPQPGQRLWFEVRRGNGEWVLQAPVAVQ